MDIVIIGAGLSGLTAAATLAEAGASVQVVEADSRIGGRIQALRDPATNRSVADLGPTWVWPKYQPVVAEWLAKLGLKTFEQFNDGDAVITGYAPKPLRQPLPGQDGMARIVGGPAALIDALSRRIGAGHIRVSAPVTAILADGPDHIAVHLNSGETLVARHAIVAVPLRVAAGGLQLPWAPQSLIGAMRSTPTWMASHAKAVALYERPFWRDAGLSGRIASRLGPLVEAHDHTCAEGAPAAIFGFVGWSPERRLQGPEGLRRAILSQLVECFGEAAADPLDLVVQDWATNRWIATDFDLAGPPEHPEIGPPVLRARHLDGRLRFAVSEMSEVSPGLIEGALSAGHRAAMDLLTS
ncbi:MAG: FAD-dependent oxidoreductase [Limimaricola sp.]|nr:FAD-dependent oxidoreductase [Limimaricola sp.]